MSRDKKEWLIKGGHLFCRGLRVNIGDENPRCNSGNQKCCYLTIYRIEKSIWAWRGVKCGKVQNISGIASMKNFDELESKIN